MTNKKKDISACKKCSCKVTKSRVLCESCYTELGLLRKNENREFMIQQRKLRGLPSNNLTEEQKEIIYNMDNVSIEIKKGKEMIVHIFNEEHKISIASDDNIEEIKDLAYKQIYNKIKGKL